MQISADKLITLGIYIALLALSEQPDRYGAKRLRRVYEHAWQLARREFTPKAPRYSQEYRDDLDYHLHRLAETVETRMGGAPQCG